MGRWVCIESGTIDIAPRYEGDRIREHIIPGTFPYRYWDVVYVEDEVSFRNENVEVHIDEQARPRMGKCARCTRVIQPQYTHCFRCHNYLQVKARIAA